VRPASGPPAPAASCSAPRSPGHTFLVERGEGSYNMVATGRAEQTRTPEKVPHWFVARKCLNIYMYNYWTCRSIGEKLCSMIMIG